MKILIAGLSKTGTTGLLYLVANSFPEKPKLYFEPKECPPDALEGSDNVVAKVLIGSNLNIESFSKFEKKITITRDPRDRIVSTLLYSQYHANYLESDDLVGSVAACLREKEKNPRSISIKEILKVIGRAARVDDYLQTYKENTRKSLQVFDKYVRLTPDGFFYRYEDFVSFRYDELAAFLGMPISGTADVPETYSRVSRTKGYGNWRDWFTEEDIAEFSPIVNPWLEKYGYDVTDWQLNPQPAIEASHCSEYFLRLVRESREKKASKAEKVKGRVSSGEILRAESGVVAGWAVGNDPSRPINVVLSVNDAEVARGPADKMRPLLKERKLHPTGRCGFAFKFSGAAELKIGDRVAVRPEDESFILKNSPVTISRVTADGNG